MFHRIGRQTDWRRGTDIQDGAARRTYSYARTHACACTYILRTYCTPAYGWCPGAQGRCREACRGCIPSHGIPYYLSDTVPTTTTNLGIPSRTGPLQVWGTGPAGFHAPPVWFDASVPTGRSGNERRGLIPNGTGPGSFSFQGALQQQRPPIHSMRVGGGVCVKRGPLL